jgi:hypothetical protein
MALVRLTREEATEGILPRVCLRCGADATVTRERTFSWHPQWVDIFLVLAFISLVFLWVAVILSIALNVRLRARVPLCDAHKNYFRNRDLFIYGGLVILALAGLVCLAVMIYLWSEIEHSELFSYLCALPLGVALVWLISAAIMQSGTVKATEINDRGITLNRVSREFIDALRYDRRADLDDDDRDRPRREYRDSDRIRDPDAPRPKRPPSDVYREEEP